MVLDWIGWLDLVEVVLCLSLCCLFALCILVGYVGLVGLCWVRLWLLVGGWCSLWLMCGLTVVIGWRFCLCWGDGFDLLVFCLVGIGLVENWS